MSTFEHSGVAAVGRRITDAPHDLAVAFLAPRSGGSWAVVVAERLSGAVIAWDGFYNDHQLPEVKSLVDLDWDEWDDMPSKLVWQSQQPWLGEIVSFWLMPTYSVARLAAGLVVTNHDLHAEQVQQLSNYVPVAYLPVVDQDVFEREVKAERAQLRSLSPRGRQD
jgi:hypothetical protein